MNRSDIIKIAKDFIAENPLAVIGTRNSEGLLWGAAVYAGCDDDFNIYFTTRSETTKHENLQENGAVSVVFVREEGQITIQARGLARLVEDSQEANSAAEALTYAVKKDTDWKPPIEKVDAGGYQLYVIEVDYARLSGFGDDQEGEQPEFIDYNK